MKTGAKEYGKKTKSAMKMSSKMGLKSAVGKVGKAKSAASSLKGVKQTKPMEVKKTKSAAMTEVPTTNVDAATKKYKEIVKGMKGEPNATGMVDGERVDWKFLPRYEGDTPAQQLREMQEKAKKKR